MLSNRSQKKKVVWCYGHPSIFLLYLLLTYFQYRFYGVLETDINKKKLFIGVFSCLPHTTKHILDRTMGLTKANCFRLVIVSCTVAAIALQWMVQYKCDFALFKEDDTIGKC